MVLAGWTTKRWRTVSQSCLLPALSRWDDRALTVLVTGGLCVSPCHRSGGRNIGEGRWSRKNSSPSRRNTRKGRSVFNGVSKTLPSFQAHSQPRPFTMSLLMIWRAKLPWSYWIGISENRDNSSNTEIKFSNNQKETIPAQNKLACLNTNSHSPIKAVQDQRMQ